MLTQSLDTPFSCNWRLWKTNRLTDINITTGTFTDCIIIWHISLCFNGHFQGGPRLASTRISLFWILLELRMTKVVVTIAAIRRAKLQSNHHHQQTNTQLFTGRMPFLSPNQQCQSTAGKNITFHGLAYPKLTWGLQTLSLTTNSSWLPWGRVSSALWSQYPT